MEGFIRQLLTLPQVQELTAGINGRERHSVVTGLSPVQRAAIAAAAAEQTGRPLLMLCADEQECARQAADLRALPVRSRWCCRLGNGSCLACGGVQPPVGVPAAVGSVPAGAGSAPRDGGHGGGHGPAMRAARRCCGRPPSRWRWGGNTT